jgi:hypothetical protein
MSSGPFGDWGMDYAYYWGGYYASSGVEYAFFTYEMNGNTYATSTVTSGLSNLVEWDDLDTAFNSIPSGGVATGLYHNHPGGTWLNGGDAAAANFYQTLSGQGSFDVGIVTSAGVQVYEIGPVLDPDGNGVPNATLVGSTYY